MKVETQCKNGGRLIDESGLSSYVHTKVVTARSMKRCNLDVEIIKLLSSREHCMCVLEYVYCKAESSFAKYF